MKFFLDNCNEKGLDTTAMSSSLASSSLRRGGAGSGGSFRRKNQEQGEDGEGGGGGGRGGSKKGRGGGGGGGEGGEGPVRKKCKHFSRSHALQFPFSSLCNFEEGKFGKGVFFSRRVLPVVSGYNHFIFASCTMMCNKLIRRSSSVVVVVVVFVLCIPPSPLYYCT